MKIYVAQSLRNEQQPEVVRILREQGHEVYDFRNPDHGFHWSEIDEHWSSWSVDQRIAVVTHPLAESEFGKDFLAMQWADACVLVLPCGRSSPFEAGYFVGADKPLLILVSGIETELMYKLADSVHSGMGTLLVRLQDLEDATN